MKIDLNDPRLTAYALGELEGTERAEFEALLEQSEDARRAVEEIRATAELLTTELRKEAATGLANDQRQAIEAKAAQTNGRPVERAAKSGIRRRRYWIPTALAASVLILVGVGYTLLPSLEAARRSPKFLTMSTIKGVGTSAKPYTQTSQPRVPLMEWQQARGGHERRKPPKRARRMPGKLKKKMSRAPAGGPARPVFGGATNAEDLEQEEMVSGTPTVSGEIGSDWGIPPDRDAYDSGFNTEAYDHVVDNPFLLATQNPLSTFSIDVDTASYANIRRFLNQGVMPPKGAVRIEEMVNYFNYSYPLPSGDDPFSVSVDVAECPWSPDHLLARIALKGWEIADEDRPAANLVLLIDVSGSMQVYNKLPLLVQSMKMLVGELAEYDRVAMVVYAGASGLVLPSTSCESKGTIVGALDRLQAGGSTNGGAGIQLAYDVAEDNFIEGGINRVVLATDGDFNVGTTNRGDLTSLIEEKAKSGVFLSVLGFGMGNLKDSTLETLADKGNGNYAYIDTLNEARKVLVEQMGGTLITIAKDVKIQIEFNPAEVEAYRLIGYENRLLAAQDFNDDTKDAGEIGAGHTVTALYEIVPAGEEVDLPDVDPLKYQTPAEVSGAAESGELMTVKLRYKEPDGDTSKLIEVPVTDGGLTLADMSDDFVFAASVASFGMILRGSPHVGEFTLDAVLELAEESLSDDEYGYRAEFVELVGKAAENQARLP